MTTPTRTPPIETTDPFDALATLVLAMLDYYAGGFRFMPEPLYP